MSIKKGFFKNNWPMILVILIAAILTISSLDVVIVVLTVVVIIAGVVKYRKYDELEQAADDWWSALSKEDKQKVKEKGAQ